MAENGTVVPTDVPETTRVVGVRFRQAGKIYYFDPGDGHYEPGDRVLVEAEDGLEVGEVAIQPKLVPSDAVVWPLRPVVRVLSEEDAGSLQQRRDAERSALQLALERAEACGLNIKFVSAEMAFDGNRLRLFFVSEERVDFRQLVRDLAGRLRARVELRQIGVRDQAKMVGGIGDCGRELCCTTWMGDFEPVSIRMAKLQNLSLNPSRLSGQCGRLKCCLKYEDEMYRELLKGLPKVGATVMTPQGSGRVIEVLTLKESVLVDLGEGRRVVVRAKDLDRAPQDGQPAAALRQAPAQEPELGDLPVEAASGDLDKGTGAPGPVPVIAADEEPEETDADAVAEPEEKGAAEAPQRPPRRRSRRSRGARSRRGKGGEGSWSAPEGTGSPEGAARPSPSAEGSTPPSGNRPKAADAPAEEAPAPQSGGARRRRRRRRPPRQDGGNG